eukprot:1179043-Prorocentrum_minimum.AAC.1
MFVCLFVCLVGLSPAQINVSHLPAPFVATFVRAADDDGTTNGNLSNHGSRSNSSHSGATNGNLSSHGSRSNSSHSDSAGGTTGGMATSTGMKFLCYANEPEDGVSLTYEPGTVLAYSTRDTR